MPPRLEAETRSSVRPETTPAAVISRRIRRRSCSGPRRVEVQNPDIGRGRRDRKRRSDRRGESEPNDIVGGSPTAPSGCSRPVEPRQRDQARFTPPKTPACRCRRPRTALVFPPATSLRDRKRVAGQFESITVECLRQQRHSREETTVARGRVLDAAADAGQRPPFLGADRADVGLRTRCSGCRGAKCRCSVGRLEGIPDSRGRPLRVDVSRVVSASGLAAQLRHPEQRPADAAPRAESCRSRSTRRREMGRWPPTPAVRQ